MVIFAGGLEYELLEETKTFVVQLDKKTCTCIE